MSFAVKYCSNALATLKHFGVDCKQIERHSNFVIKSSKFDICQEVQFDVY